MQFLPTSQIAEGCSGIVYSCVQSSALNAFLRGTAGDREVLARVIHLQGQDASGIIIIQTIILEQMLCFYIDTKTYEG